MTTRLPASVILACICHLVLQSLCHSREPSLFELPTVAKSLACLPKDSDFVILAASSHEIEELKRRLSAIDHSRLMERSVVLLSLQIEETSSEQRALADTGSSLLPQLLFCDNSSKPYARFTPGAKESDLIDAFKGARITRLRRDEAFAEAKSLNGAEKARKLDGGISAIGINLALRYYQVEIAEIEALDLDGKLGLAAKYRAARKTEEFESKSEIVLADALSLFAKMNGQEFEETLKGLDRLKDQYKGDNIACQILDMQKFRILVNNRRFAKALEVLDVVEQLGAESPIGVQVPAFRQRIIRAEKLWKEKQGSK